MLIFPAAKLMTVKLGESYGTGFKCAKVMKELNIFFKLIKVRIIIRKLHEVTRSRQRLAISSRHLNNILNNLSHLERLIALCSALCSSKPSGCEVLRNKQKLEKMCLMKT